MEERRCYRGCFAASKATGKTANCARFDCVLFLQARKLGLAVLTANVRDYDILLQLVPEGRALFYRRK